MNANFLTWANPEVSGGSRYLSLYYFGSLDDENPPGLYRLLRYATTQTGGYISKVPLNVLVNNAYSTVNTAQTSIATYGYGKHYLGLSSANSSVVSNKLLSFLVTSSGSGTPQGGVYETQVQLFSKKKTAKQIRVYTEPTSTGQGFQLDCIGTDGQVITNGTFSYSYVAGSDLTTLTGSLERINFNPAMQDVFGLGIRVTNTGSSNMTIKKIEVDIEDSGK